MTLKIYPDGNSGWSRSNAPETFEVTEGTPLQVSWSHWGDSYGNGKIKTVLVNGTAISSDQFEEHSYTSQKLTKDTKIEVVLTENLNPDNGNLSVTYQTPHLTLDTSKEEEVSGSEIELNSGNSWSHTWDLSKLNLGSTNSEGEQLYYYVKETTALNGYTTTYRSNDGKNSGNITVINQKKRETPGPSTTYSLPATGGSGTILLRAVGICLIAAGVVLLLLRSRKKRDAEKRGAGKRDS